MTKEKTFNFEESMEKLENIVKSLESENQSLEKSIDVFEKGLSISKELKTHLDKVPRLHALIHGGVGGLRTLCSTSSERKQNH